MRRIRVETLTETFEAWFHCWAGTSEHAYPIVERLDGEIEEVKMVAKGMITFLDPPEPEGKGRPCEFHEHLPPGGEKGWRYSTELIKGTFIGYWKEVYPDGSDETRAIIECTDGRVCSVCPGHLPVAFRFTDIGGKKADG